MSDFDSNTWYQITDSTKGPAYGLTGSGGVGSWINMGAYNSSNPACHWQILAASTPSTFFLRSGDPGPGFQLGSERANLTQNETWGQPAGMLLTDFSDTAQQWLFDKWPADQLWRLSTVANGTSWILGWQGGAAFMSSRTNSSGGHWAISNRGAINDAAYSTSASASSTSSTQIPSSSTTPPATSPSPSTAALGSGTIAGIVIASVVPVLILLVIILFLCRKLRRRRKMSEPFEIPERQELFKPDVKLREEYKGDPHELSSWSAMHEVADTRRAELDS